MGCISFLILVAEAGLDFLPFSFQNSPVYRLFQVAFR